MIVTEKKKHIDGCHDLAGVLTSILLTESQVDRDKEHVWIVGLNTKNVIQYIDLTGLGTLNAAMIHPREIFRLAILKGVNTIVFAHNHPSGDPTPSAQDETVFLRLEEAGRILGISVMDCLIVTEDPDVFYSHQRGR